MIEGMIKPLDADIAKFAPEFVLKDTAAEEFKLSDFRGKSPVVLVFNRGFT